MKEINELFDNLKLDENINLNDIPNIDLYMDQVIQLFESKLSSSKRKEEDKILTKTMINNYSKGKLLMNIKNKKYSKNHIILMCLIYELKGSMSIPDIKNILDPIVKSYDNEENKYNLELIYNKYIEKINENMDNIKDEVSSKEINADNYEEKLLLLLILTNKANIYRRMAEKIVDELLI